MFVGLTHFKRLLGLENLLFLILFPLKEIFAKKKLLSVKLDFIIMLFESNRSFLLNNFIDRELNSAKLT